MAAAEISVGASAGLSVCDDMLRPSMRTMTAAPRFCRLSALRSAMPTPLIRLGRSHLG